MFPVSSSSSNFTPSLVDQQKEDQISKLIDGLFINEGNIDTAFDLSKTMESSVTLHFMLSDVCNAYLKLRTEEGCRKAYKVAQYKEKQRADVRKLLNSIIESCIQIKSPKSILLAEEIYENNSKCLALSPHKNDFHRIKTQLEHNYKNEIESEINKEKELRVNFPNYEKPINYESNIKNSSTSLNQNREEIKSKDVLLPITEEEKKKLIFNSIASNELEALRIQLECLDSLQKSKYFSSVMKFETSWARGEEEMTPLQYACFLGHIESVKILVENGASVNDFRNTSDSTQRNCLHFAIDADHFDVALLLLSKGAKDRLASCDTFHAFRKYQLPEEWGGSWTCLSALHMAIIKNSHELVGELLKAGDAKILVKASGVNSPLHLAARSGDEKMVKLLLSLGANTCLNLKDSVGRTPKQVATSKKHEHLLELLS